MRSLKSCIVAALAVAALAAAQSKPPDPDGMGFENKSPSDAGWFVPTPGWNATLSAENPAVGKHCAVLAPAGADTAGFGNLMRSIDATPYVGSRVVLTSQLRVVGGGQGQMWARVDRKGGAMGAFDNMDDRPIRAATWSPAKIELDVDVDAAAIALGFMSVGNATLCIDDVHIAVIGAVAPSQPATPPTALTPRGLANVEAAAKLISYLRFFSPSDQTVGVGNWEQVAVDAIEAAEPARDANELAQRLVGVLQPIAPTLEVWAGGIDKAPPLPAPPTNATALASWTHRGAGSISSNRQGNVYSSEVERTGIDKPLTPEAFAECFTTKDLGAGVSCRWARRAAADDAGTLPHGTAPTLGVQSKLTLANRSTRLAGVALAWGVFEHFFPYFDVVKTDWPAALPIALEAAATAADDRAFLDTLRELVAKLHDGHGNVAMSTLQARSMLPFALEWAGDDLVVVGADASVANDVHVGDVIDAIDDRATADCYAEVAKQISFATDGWCRWVALQSFLYRLKTRDPAIVRIRRLDGAVFEIPVKRIPITAIPGATAKRPENGSELAPGIVYFDLNGADSAALAKSHAALDAAKGIVFDLRGYPNQAAYEVVQHLITGPATSAKWIVPKVTKPDQDGIEWIESGRWQVAPLTPHWNVPIAFVTDGRAISYAESIMGIVEAYKLGAIVGSTTAGTNGNVNPFILPGGVSVYWTGMRVLKHDGSQHHGIGIAPTDPIKPTAKGIAERKDEVLEKAIEVVKARMATAPH